MFLGYMMFSESKLMVKFMHTPFYVQMLCSMYAAIQYR